MGLQPQQVRRTTLKEFNLMLTGYMARQDREWNRTRHLMSYIANFAGMGTTEFLSPEKIWPLPMDRENEKRMITTIAQALALLKTFE